MFITMQNCVIEWSYVSEKGYKDPFNEIELSAVITDPDGDKKVVPAFWAGGQVWRLRYASPKIGCYHFCTVCSY